MGRPDPSHNHSELWATFVGSRGHVSSAWGAAPLCPIASGGPSDDSVLPWAEEPTIEAILDRREEQEARDEAERYGLTPDPEFLAYEKALAERAKSLPPPELGYDVVGLEAIDFGFELLPHDELEIAMIQAGQLCRMGFGWSAGCFRIRKIDQDWDQAIDSVVILRDDRRTALVKGFYDRSRADFSPRIRETSGAHGEDAVP